jgi:hypothetical protein
MYSSNDEFLGNIVVDNITRDNINIYIRKDRDNYASVVDAIVLLTQRPREICADVIPILFELADFRASVRTFEDFPEPALRCDDLINLLLHLPGRECLFRLHRYCEHLIAYLDGDIMLAGKIDNRRNRFENEINSALHPPRKRCKYSFANKLEELDKIVEKHAQVAKRLEKFSKSIGSYPEDGTKQELLEFFTKKCIACINEEETSSEDSNNATTINEERRKTIEDAMKKSNSKRVHGVDEVKWTDIIVQMGYRPEWQLTRMCGKLGAKMKRENGETKGSSFGGRCEKFVYYESDLPKMQEIIDNVYAEQKDCFIVESEDFAMHEF